MGKSFDPIVLTDMCRHKARYASKGQARAIARRRKSQVGIALTVYKCPYCAGWHLTKKEAA